MKCWVSTAVFISGSIDLVSLRRSAGESGRAVAVGDYMEAAFFLAHVLVPAVRFAHLTPPASALAFTEVRTNLKEPSGCATV